VKKMLGLALLTNFLISANITEKTQKMEKMPGYINMYWDKAEGKAAYGYTNSIHAKSHIKSAAGHQPHDLG